MPEREVRAKIRRLALRDRMVVEGSAALSVAAALAAPRERREGSVCLVTGGSIGSGLLREILGDRPPPPVTPGSP